MNVNSPRSIFFVPSPFMNGKLPQSQTCLAEQPLMAPSARHRVRQKLKRVYMNKKNVMQMSEPSPLPGSPLSEGDEVKGKVTGVTAYGAFVQLPNGQSGLVHISEIADSFISSVSGYVSVGDMVHVRVLSINPKSRKIALSIKQAVAARATGYDRVVELGGDWGHPWNDDGKTNFLKLSSTPQTPGPHHWEPDLSLFKPFDEHQDDANSSSTNS